MSSINGKQMIVAAGAHHTISDTLAWFDARCSQELGISKVPKAARLIRPDRVRELTAHCHGTPKAPSNSGRRPKLNSDAIALAERMIYKEGQSYLAAALAIGCSQSRIYAVLADRRYEARKSGKAIA